MSGIIAIGAAVAVITGIGAGIGVTIFFFGSLSQLKTIKNNRKSENLFICYIFLNITICTPTS